MRRLGVQSVKLMSLELCRQRTTSNHSRVTWVAMNTNYPLLAGMADGRAVVARSASAHAELSDVGVYIRLRCAGCRHPAPMMGTLRTELDDEAGRHVPGRWVLDRSSQRYGTQRDGTVVRIRVADQLDLSRRGIELACRRCGSSKRLRRNVLLQEADALRDAAARGERCDVERDGWLVLYV